MKLSQILKFYALLFLLCLALILLFAVERKVRAGTEREPELIGPVEAAPQANNQAR